MKKIIIDTNFLLIPYQFKVDIFSEIRRICSFRHSIFIIDKTYDELKKIVAEQKGKNRMAAMLGLVLVQEKKIESIKTKDGKSVDELILENAEKGAIVATQDAELKRKLKKKGAGLIVLRGKTHLELLEG